MSFFDEDTKIAGEITDGAHEVKCLSAEMKDTKSGGKMINCRFEVDGRDSMWHSFFIDDPVMQMPKEAVVGDLQKKYGAIKGNRDKLFTFLTFAGHPNPKAVGAENLHEMVGLTCTAEVKSKMNDFTGTNRPEIRKFIKV